MRPQYRHQLPICSEYALIKQSYCSVSIDPQGDNSNSDDWFHFLCSTLIQ